MLTAWLLAAALLAASGGRVLNLENLTAPELDALDREATVFLLTFGNLEAHGPYLPVGSDLFLATGLRDRVVAEVRKGWQQQAGFDTHSGAAETSAILHLRPELVKPGYRDAPPSR
jgi:creatinine amidohydrolase/Fe(II)-dependent formamide hydrolase-like protein